MSASEKPWKVVISHHPVDTYSGHGSHQTLGNWVWTGTRGAVSRSFTGPRVALLSSGIFIGALISPIGWALAGAGLLMAPVSVVGDKIHKHPQDTDHWAYSQFAENLVEIADRYHALLVSGHDHNLQLIRVTDRVMQVVSGSAGKVSWVAGSGGDLLYSASKPGFVRFDLNADQLWMQFCTVDINDPAADCGVTFTLPADRGEAASNR